jgi:methyl-accepting chemotaxis protein
VLSICEKLLNESLTLNDKIAITRGGILEYQEQCILICNEIISQEQAGINSKNFVIRFKAILTINKIKDHTNRTFINSLQEQIYSTDSYLANAITDINEAKVSISDMRTLSSRYRSDINLLRLDSIFTSYSSALNNLIIYNRKIRQLDDKRTSTGNHIFGEFMEVASSALGKTVLLTQESMRDVFRANIIIASGTIIILIVSILLSIALTRMITTPIRKSVDFAKEIANGNLSATINFEQEDEIGELVDSLNQMKERIGCIINEIQQGASEIALASDKISKTAQSLSRSSSRQASSVEEISSSMEQMFSNIQSNTENSKITEKISIQALNEIREGSSQASVSADNMKNIAGKVAIIGDISFQTNILALNAAVEAARAGDYGRGFAVVAAEVRKLAERSKIAAEEINRLSSEGLLNSSVAGNKLNGIVPEMEKTTKLIQEITASSIEQTSGMGQTNKVIEQLNSTTQHNASLSEILASNSDELSHRAYQLKEAISYFKIKKRT